MTSCRFMACFDDEDEAMEAIREEVTTIFLEKVNLAYEEADSHNVARVHGPVRVHSIEEQRIRDCAYKRHTDPPTITTS